MMFLPTKVMESCSIFPEAHRQLAAYQKNNDLNEVTALLMEQTLQGIELDAADLSEHYLQFKMYETAG